MSDFFDIINSQLDDKNDPQGQEFWRKYWIQRNKKGEEWANTWAAYTKDEWARLLEEAEMKKIDKISPGNEITSENEKPIYDVGRPPGHFLSPKLKRK